MHTFIALSVEERATYCRQAAETLPYPIPAAVIEKDFWVSWLLQVLMEHPLQKRVSFHVMLHPRLVSYVLIGCNGRTYTHFSMGLLENNDDP